MVFRRIKDLREDRDLTQNDLSEYLNIARRTYSHYETGTHNIPTDIWIKLGNFYGVSIDYLMERTDKKEVNR